MRTFPAKLLLAFFVARLVSAVFIILIAFTVVGCLIVAAVAVAVAFVAIMPLLATEAAVYHPVGESQM